MKLLLIDDDPVGRTGLAELLVLDGHEVETGAGALDLVRRLSLPPPDAVVLDVRLPGTDGLVLLDHLRQCRGWENVPVVMATAAAEVTLAPDGPTAIVYKPFTVHDLMAALAALGQVRHRR